MIHHFSDCFAIPYPKLLIKDQKKINKKGEYPTRLVITATNLAPTLSNIGYLGIKQMLDKAKVNYSRFTIVQEYDLKEKLEKIGVNRDKGIIESIDYVNMYLYIKTTTFKKWVR